MRGAQRQEKLIPTEEIMEGFLEEVLFIWL